MTVRQIRRERWARAGAIATAAALIVLGTGQPSWAAAPHSGDAESASPVKHLVVIFDENISFDHYFATYPNATNENGTRFTPSKDTPKDIDTLAHAGLIDDNPNQYAPKRLGPAQGMTCDQKHDYGNEQHAYNGGSADKFVENTESSKCSGGLFGEPGLVMDYYDGNTVTALWNYAQHYAMSDRSFGDVYGPSTPGAIDVVSGNTHGVVSAEAGSGTEDPQQTTKPQNFVQTPDHQGVGTLISDPHPAFDDCSDNDHTSDDPTAIMKGRNIGDLLNAKGVSWGWFQGGFRPATPWDGKQGHYAECQSQTHANAGGAQVVDYIPHHEPFQYYKSTANPHHLPPKNTREIGHDGQANHQYDIEDFDSALKTARLPSVSYLKAPGYQDGHAGTSSPLDEQHFLTSTINKIQRSPQWKDTAIVVAYDDSDGWYDHVMAPVKNGSEDSAVDSTGRQTDGPACQAGPAAAGGYKDRCSPGARQPLLVISPYSKVNKVDHTPTQQSSVLKFIEDNWHLGRLGDASFDVQAGSLNSLFDFGNPHQEQLLLNANGSVRSLTPTPRRIPTVSSASVDSTLYDRLQATVPSSHDSQEISVLTVAASIGGLVVGAVALHRIRTRRAAGHPAL
ncbi:alkaline phosphatase family protein [Streptomyces sp. NPDC006552]|uniref:phospholipase C n=1 Tax=Streptomyces sp. NPDC006552 TaxID=3157179 RepID=UPI0033B16F77